MCEFTWIQLGLEGVTDYELAEELHNRVREVPGVLRVSLDLATRSVRLAITSPALTILPVLSALEGVGVRAVEEDAYLELGNLRVPPGVLLRDLGALPGVRQVGWHEETGLLCVRYVAGCVDVPDLVRACSVLCDEKPRSGDA